MSLANRLSAFFLAALGLVLVGFSGTLYLLARTYLDRQVDDHLRSTLAVLTAGAEIHRHDVEWEPQERILPLGQDAGPDRPRWLVLDGRGRRIDRSRNLDDAELTPEWTPRPGTTVLPTRLKDRRGLPWKVAQNRLVPDREGVDPREFEHPGRKHQALVLTAFVPTGPAEEALATLGVALAGTSAALWALAALLGRRLCRKALAPLIAMVASARGVDPADPGWSLAEVGADDELDQLRRAFNDLLARLRVAFERQRRFSGDASHQLRTPLTALIGQIEVALRRDRSAEEYRRVLVTALEQAEHLRRIVEALLFLSRAEADAALPDVEPLDLPTWLAEHLARRGEGPRADDLHFEPARGPLVVRAHAPLLGQLLDNLLDNAAKYSPAGTPIVVATAREGPWGIFAVIDSGPGIPPEDVPRIFEPFYRSPRALRLGRPGVGLGLSIARRIAEALGGTIRVLAPDRGGARFEVLLPAIIEDAADHPQLANGMAGSSIPRHGPPVAALPHQRGK
ncbi:MAG TPA: ATP-binding protein [Isosphaeraceae bacterium]|jgi:signal transduction histidine kinase|nr:ATP-binding protein [Isosphaeraceae bacterium]